MSEPTLHLVTPEEVGREHRDEREWLGWLQARLDPDWRPGEWGPPPRPL